MLLQKFSQRLLQSLTCGGGGGTALETSDGDTTSDGTAHFEVPKHVWPCLLHPVIQMQSSILQRPAEGPMNSHTEKDSAWHINRVLWFSLGWPGTIYVDQDRSFKPRDPPARIKGMCYHAQHHISVLFCFFLQDLFILCVGVMSTSNSTHQKRELDPIGLQL